MSNADKTERAQYACLSVLGGLDAHDVNLRDNPAAYVALDELISLAYAEGRDDQRQDDAKALDVLASTIRIGL